MPNFPDRVATKAADVRVGRLLLSLLALPFYVLGFVIGVVWVAIRWIFAAVVVGFADVGTIRRVSGDDAG